MTATMAHDRARLHIAIVEDDPAVLNSLEFMFTTEGYRVSAYDCAGDAAASDALRSADCLIVDYGLPDFDGLTLLRRLRNGGFTAPAIVIASMPSQRCRREARDLAAPLVEKPLQGDSLGLWVQRVISQSAVSEPALAARDTPS